jgi:hypothetical protein
MEKRVINFKKIFLILFTVITHFSISFAVQIAPTNNNNNNNGVDEGFKGIVITIFTIGIIFLLFVGLMILFAWILFKIYTKLSELNRKKKHLIYEMFSYDLMQCHFNSDTEMKKRNWKFLWLFWKRRPVYIEKDDGTLDIIGQYHGECYKKEGFYLIGLYNKVGLFKYVGQIIIIPLKIKDKVVKKIQGDKSKTMFLSCEGIDSIQESDYYYIPLIKDYRKENKFIDFADDIHKNYVELKTYRDIITENLNSSKEMVIKSVETNPFVHFGRRGGENFKK